MPSQHASRLRHLVPPKHAEIVLLERLADFDGLPDEFVVLGCPLTFTGRDGLPIGTVALCP